ncbi:MAG: MATE family efflux transporter [Rhodospirillaceae bacterium]|nr:MATE family efflux transporter [Rhodospirillaceae bacterium]
MGAVDTAVMGHLPDAAYIGGVALGGLVINYVYWSFGFLRMSTTGFVAQANGARDGQELRHVTLRAVLLALVLGAFILALQRPIADLALVVLDGSDKVKALARDYVLVRIWGTPATLITYIAWGWFIGMQRTRAVLAFTVGQNALNAVLAIWFVQGLGWGIKGVAAATLIAECSSAMIGCLIVWRGHSRFGGSWKAPGLFDRRKLAGLFHANGNMFLRTLLLLTGFAWFGSQGARQGDLVIAANTVLSTFIVFAAFGLDGFANAAEALVGGAVGARDRAAFRAAVAMTTAWAAAVAAAAALVILVVGPAVIDLMTVHEAVRAEARRFLFWAALYPLVAVWCFQLDGIYIGATRTAEMRNGAVLAVGGMLAVGYGLMPSLGNHGLWAALLAFAAIRGLTLGLWYPRLLAQFGPRLG